MASVMGIVSEVFGSCVEEIDVYVEVECLALLWVEIFEVYFCGKAAQDRQCKWEMVPGIGCCF